MSKKYMPDIGQHELENWSPEIFLGKGGYGNVWLCKRRDNPQIFKAIKKIKRDDPEFENYSEFQNDNIIKVLGKINGQGRFWRYNYLIFPNYDCDLQNYMIFRRKLLNSEIVILIKGILSGLNEINSKGLAHMDIKASNILVNKIPLQFCIADLGLVQERKKKCMDYMDGRMLGILILNICRFDHQLPLYYPRGSDIANPDFQQALRKFNFKSKYVEKFIKLVFDPSNQLRIDQIIAHMSTNKTKRIKKVN